MNDTAPPAHHTDTPSVPLPAQPSREVRSAGGGGALCEHGQREQDYCPYCAEMHAQWIGDAYAARGCAWVVWAGAALAVTAALWLLFGT